MTPDDVLAQVSAELAERVRSYEARRDSRCVFAFCYYLLTVQLLRELPKSDIGDRAWIARLARGFADRYFDALDGGRARPLSPAWASVFARTRDRYTSVLEHVVFGMAAHIIADLPHVLAEVSMMDDGGRTRVKDYHAMNEVLGHAIDPIQRAVSRRYAPYVRWLDRLTKGQGELLTNYGIRLTRAAAWYNGVRLLEPDIREDAADSIQKSAIFIVDELTRPPFWSARLVFRTLRVVAAWFRRWPTEPLPPVH